MWLVYKDMKKEKRQKYIVDILNSKVINTQNDLTYELQKLGVESTQATISRDIKELNIIKVQNKDGESEYRILDKFNEEGNNRLAEIFKLAVDSYNINKDSILINTLNNAGYLCADYIKGLGLAGLRGIVDGSSSVLLFTDPNVDKEDLANKIKESTND